MFDMEIDSGQQAMMKPFATERREPQQAVNVNVKSAAYTECMDNLDLDIMGKQNAHIWCLRSSLWSYHNSESAFGEDDELYILQVSNKQNRTKRSTRFIRRRLAPRDMTKPPSGFRTRREYRTLSVKDRKKFHDALNELYKVRYS